MSTNVEYCDPFSEETENDIWMRLEHCGRYVWAQDMVAALDARSVADVACADGYGTAMLAHVANQVVGVDRNESYLDMARRLYGGSGATFIQADLGTQGWARRLGHFEMVACFETLEHVHDPLTLLHGIAEMLAPRGTLLLSVPNPTYERFDEQGNNLDVYHLHVFERDDLEAMLRGSGFAVSEVLGQDICNRMLGRLDELSDQGHDAEMLARIVPDPRGAEEMLLFARAYAYPTSHAPEYSYSTIFVCERIEDAVGDQNYRR